MSRLYWVDRFDKQAVVDDALVAVRADNQNREIYWWHVRLKKSGLERYGRVGSKDEALETAEQRYFEMKEQENEPRR